MENLDSNEIKKKVGYALVDAEVRSGTPSRPFKLGLGTGTTAIHAIRRLGQLLSEGKIHHVVCVATSLQSQLEAQSLGIPVTDLNDPRLEASLDLSFDGADQVSPEDFLIKGGGAAHTREKIVASRAERFVVVVDESKFVPVLGVGFDVPVEVHPLAIASVSAELNRHLEAKVRLRESKGKIGAVISDNGFPILDVHFPQGLPAGTELDPQAVESFIKMLPGVLDVGLFTLPVAAVYCGLADGSVKVRKGRRA